MQIALVKAYGWTLQDIEETDIEVLIPFLVRINAENAKAEPKRETVNFVEVRDLFR